MTNGQAKWLRENPAYEIIGSGGASKNGQTIPDVRGHLLVGALSPEGVFAKIKAVAPAILVGIRKPPPSGIPGGAR